MTMMMTTLMATIMIVMMCRGPASPADSPAVPTPRGLDPIALDRWVGNHTVLVFLHLQVSRVDSKLSFSSGGRKAFALDSQGLPMRTNRMTEGDLIADIYIFDKYGNFWTSKYILEVTKASIS